ncbi:MAG: ATP-dependent RecD-like DNA helicase [Clostridia bacterium]|nr:ATP-dependent RecD-like DNA helicase [Clostridia bacterium]
MKIKGTVSEVVFCNAENGYTVVNLEVDGREITAVGILPVLVCGEVLSLEGKYTTHSKFGTQFEIESYRFDTPDSLDGIVKYLASGLIKGVGEKTAEKIVKHFGKDTLNVIEKDPDKLAEIKGISKTKALDIYNGYCELKKMQRQIMFLQSYGITVNLAIKIYNVYKEHTEEIVTNNPYKLIDDIDGVGFATADRVANSLGISRDSVFRMRAGVVYTLKESGEKQGNTFLHIDDLKQKVTSLLCIDNEILEKNFDEVLSALQLDMHVSLLFISGKQVVALTKYLNIEKSVASRLVKLKNEVYKMEQDFDKLVDSFEKGNKLKFHESQRNAIINASKSGVTVITGGPGTGKTTIVKCICQLFRLHGMKVALAAPTGRASKRLAEATGQPAKTIHRLLGCEFAGGKVHFAYNEYNPLDADVLIVDETSMVDCIVFNSLLKALPKGCRLVLVGDKDQLPSVGAGNVLGDVIASGLFEINYLTYIYRQASDSLIVSNAHLINQGKMPVFNNKSQDFFHLPTSDTQETANHVVSLVTTRLPGYTKTDMREIQVLSPMKIGPAGVENLNRLLQQQINPYQKGKNQLNVGNTIFREGDKVMQTQNDYEIEWMRKVDGAIEFGQGVFNGDIGYITKVNVLEGFLEVTFDDGRVTEYNRSDMSSLMLAYAITVHKSQGCEFDVVVIPLYGGAPTIINKNLLYTAVTRAKKYVVLVGSKKYISVMIHNNFIISRNTMLKHFLSREQAKYDSLYGDLQ